MSVVDELIGESRAIAAVRSQIARLTHQTGRRPPPILIQGETGTGKGLLAHIIHRAGARAERPFVDVNCAAIPETLLEAELFGFERGAFTDARQAKPGLFQAADGGTIFLDEVGLLPDAMQAKLLKVLEDLVVRRLGSTRTEPVDVAVISATNEDLDAATRARRFRADLYHRLAVLTVTLPPIRERGRDVVILAEHLLARVAADYGLPARTFAPDALAALQAYGWPGNVRELGNVIERAALLSNAPILTADMLGLGAPVPKPAATPTRAVSAGARPTASGAAMPAASSMPRTVPATSTGAVERDALVAALQSTGWNISRAAAALGISRNTIRYRIEKYGLRPSDVAPPPIAEPAEPLPAAAPPAAIPVLRWERRRVAFMRMDLVAESGAPAFGQSARVLEVAVDKIRMFGGRVEDLSRHTVVASFGLEAVEDAPWRAANVAAAIRKATERQPGAASPATTRMTVAIDVSEAMVGRFDGASEVDRDAKGAAVASLGDAIAKLSRDGIFLSEAARPFVEGRCELEPVIAGAEQFYRIVRREPYGLGARRRLSAFVGRAQELALLRDRLERARSGRGQLVGISGDPGIGKSRLVLELRRSLAAGSVTWVAGRCASFGAAVPYLPVIEIVSGLVDIAEMDPPATAVAKLGESLAAFGMDAGTHGAALLHVLGLKEGADDVVGLAPEVLKVRTMEALRQLVLRASRRTPLAVMVDDLHWVDSASEDFLASLAEQIAGAALLVIVTYRPGYRPPWIDKSYATQIALQPLTTEESLTVVRSVLGADPVSPAVEQLVLSRGEGNPFFLEELARTVREDERSASLGVPDTIEAILLARIDRLDAADKHLIQAAAVIGHDVPRPLVAAVAGLSDTEVERGLERLLTAEFLYDTSAGGEAQYTFKHVLTQDVAYASLLPEARAELHAGAAAAIERLYADRLPEQTERLAHHSFHGGLWDTAASTARLAGHRALERVAYAQAVAWFEQALAALAHLPETPARAEQKLGLRFDLRTALTPLGDHVRIRENLEQAQRLAESLGDARRVGRAQAYLAAELRLIGEPERAIEIGREALRVAEREGDFALQIATNTYLGQASHTLGEYRRAAAFLRRNVELLAGDLVRETFGLPFVSSVHSRVWLVQCFRELGEFDAGIPVGREAIRVAESLDHQLSLSTACTVLGALYLQRGEVDAAIPLLERGFALSRDWNFGLWLPMASSFLGSAYAFAGRLADAVPLLEDAVNRQRAIGRMAFHSLRIVSLAEAEVMLGRVTDAMTHARRALELAREHKERGNEGHALRVLADAAARGNAVDVADESYRAAIARATSLEMKPLLAHGQLGLGRLHAATARPDAERSLSAALSLFRELGMQTWAERAGAELDRLR